MKKKIIVLLGVASGILLVASPVFAHSVVTPKEVGVAATVDFMLSVPTENPGTTTSVRLLLPSSVNIVTPVAKAGWKVNVKTTPVPSGAPAPKAADGDVMDSIPTEIYWTGGAIPEGQKDIFVFTAQAPAQPTELDWKVYQGYADGTTVSWDLGPHDVQPKDSSGKSDFSAKGPYSMTMVINDLTSPAPRAMPNSNTNAATLGGKSSNIALILSLIAIVLSIGTCCFVIKKKM